jgi:hypothetical protein
MSPFRIGVALLSLSFVLVGRGIWTAQPSAAGHSVPIVNWQATPVAEPAPLFDLERDEDFEPSKVDVLGNEVDDAVGDYRVDIRGDIYERHSPETEVTRLKPPVS